MHRCLDMWIYHFLWSNCEFLYQLTAELLSSNGNVLAASSQPSMLRFRSLPVQIARTFFMGIPLLLGVPCETQKITVDMLKHKEGNQRTEVIRVKMIPRAGTLDVPDIYEAEVIVKSQMPWLKQLIHNWRWTFYVWASLYLYIMFLVILICYFRPLVFPAALLSFTTFSERHYKEMQTEELIDSLGGVEDESRLEYLRKWRIDRSKRGTASLQGTLPAGVSSPASSISLKREDTSTNAEEDIDDSESICLDASSST